MARVTVEDCIDKVNNRFELVIIAAERTKDLSSGSRSTVNESKHKLPVVALYEIAAGNIDVEQVRQNLIRGVKASHIDTNPQDMEVSEEVHEAFENNDEFVPSEMSFEEKFFEDEVVIESDDDE